MLSTGLAAIHQYTAYIRNQCFYGGQTTRDACCTSQTAYSPFATFFIRASAASKKRRFKPGRGRGSVVFKSLYSFHALRICIYPHQNSKNYTTHQRKKQILLQSFEREFDGRTCSIHDDQNKNAIIESFTSGQSRCGALAAWTGANSVCPQQGEKQRSKVDKPEQE